MKTIHYPLLKPSASRIGLGCMHFGGNWRKEEQADAKTLARARTATETALEVGINFFDHADIYCSGKSEVVFSKVMRDLSLDRAEIILQTKCGIRFGCDPDPDSPGRYDFSKEHILRSVEGSLKRLETDYIDILLLHRPDALMEPEEIGEAFAQLHEAGKVRAFGVSNQTPAQMQLLQSGLTLPLVANQVEINPLKTALFDAGIVSHQRGPAPGYTADGTLEYHRLHKIITQAWAPLAYGYLSGREDDPDPQNPNIPATADVIQQLTSKYNAPAEAIVIAWLLRHPAGIQPIIGTRDPDRIRASAKADELTLSREDWYRIYIAGRGSPLP